MATTYLSRTVTGSSTTKATYSAWVKRSGLGEKNLTAIKAGSNQCRITFTPSDELQVFMHDGSYQYRKVTDRLFRDTSGYYHIVIAFDSTEGAAGDRIKIYINGVQETEFNNVTDPGASDDCFWFQSATGYLGIEENGSSNGFDGLMTHINMVQGTALAPTEFGEFDSTSGIWKIKTSCYATPGSQGFCLKMETTTGSGMGTDSSGNGNNFTEGGSPTQTVDNPSSVMATFNFLDNYYNSSTLSNGNTTVVTSPSGYTSTKATLGVTKGKWFWETKYVSKTGGYKYPMIGISSTQVSGTNQELGHFANDWGYLMDNTTPNLRNNDASTSYGDSYTEGDIIGVGLDLDNNKLYFAVNGTWVNSGVPTSGATGTGALSITAPASTPIGAYFPAVGYWDGTYGGTFETNFGNGKFGTTSISSAGTSSTGDDSIWEYDCPTGYYGLNTKNINTYG